jgi:SOS-response transcriptional repressor LexA
MTAAERLKTARIQRGFETATSAAESFGWKQVTYISNENGYAPFSYKRANQYARAFRVSAEWLYSGKGEMFAKAEQNEYQIVGHINSGGEACFIDQSTTQIPPEYIKLINAKTALAFRVKGQSMIPRFFEGETLIFGAPKPLKELINQEIMAILTNGNVLIKILRRGQLPNTWDLHSYNSLFPPIENAAITEARPFAIMVK